MKKNWKILTAMTVVLLVMSSYTYHVSLKQKKNEQMNKPAMKAFTINQGEASYTDLAGNPISLTDFVGKIIVVNVWASWSPFSANDLQNLVDIAKEVNEEEIEILAINRAEPATTAERYLSTIGVLDNVTLVLDPGDKYYKSIGGYAMPETVIYDKEGNVFSHRRGVIKKEEVEADIKSLQI